ncbi:MAG: histidine phosphatase family protein [Alphaproteobacteria bacterium]
MIPNHLLPQKFYFLRHGQSTANQQKIMAGGKFDSPLSDLGRQQAEKAAEVAAHLFADQPVTVFHSHLQRASHTALLASRYLQAGLVCCPELREQEIGTWEAQPWDMVLPLMHQGIDPPQGENSQQFRQRAAVGFRAAFQGRSMPLIVAHGGVFHGFCGMMGYRLRDFIVPNALWCRFTRVDESPDENRFPYRIEKLSLNENSQLQAEELQLNLVPLEEYKL